MAASSVNMDQPQSPAADVQHYDRHSRQFYSHLQLLDNRHHQLSRSHLHHQLSRSHLHHSHHYQLFGGHVAINQIQSVVLCACVAVNTSQNITAISAAHVVRLCAISASKRLHVRTSRRT
jgi:hypothetical protein